MIFITTIISTRGAKNIMNKYKIGGIPVLSSEKKLVGIVTNRDLRFEKNNKKSIKSIMTSSSLITSTKNISLSDAEIILQKNKIEKLPIINSNNELVGLITFRDIMKVKKQPNACKDNHGRLRVAAAIGVGEKGISRCSALVEAGVDAVVIDTAHGHSKGVINLLKKVKKQYPDLDTVVGNIATGDAALDLVRAGADAVFSQVATELEDEMYMDSPLAAGTYHYYVTQTYEGVESDTSNNVMVSVYGADDFTATTDIMVEGNDYDAMLEWTAPDLSAWEPPAVMPILPSNDEKIDDPSTYINYNPADYYSPRQGGDTDVDATVIDALPYLMMGTTVGYTDDYDEECP